MKLRIIDILCFSFANGLRILPGTSEVKISNMGIGTWAWGDKFFWNYKTGEDEELQNVFNYCSQALKDDSKTLPLFDTAEIYGFGRSELLLGRFQRNLSSQLNSVAFATKFAPLPWKIGSDIVVQSCKESLDRMGVAKMALFQLHWSQPWQDENYWEGLAQCYKLGLVDCVGVSNYGPVQLRKVHKYLKDRGVPLATNQIQYSLLCRSPENDLLKTASELGVSILAYSPLAQGILTGKFTLTNLPDGPRKLLVGFNLLKSNELLKTMKEIAELKTQVLGFEVSLSQVAINWCIAKGTIPIPGARNMRQAIDNCNALKWSLDEPEVVKLDIKSKESGVNLVTPLQGE